MNIFHLDENIELSARYHCDSHVVKMVLEYAQILCSAHHILGKNPNKDLLYKLTHTNHPCCIWARSSDKNYQYLYDLFLKLAEEYTYRYNKYHKTYSNLKDYLITKPENIPITDTMTKIPLTMPDEYKNEDPIISYRNFYISKAKAFKMKWTKRSVPYWFIE